MHLQGENQFINTYISNHNIAPNKAKIMAGSNLGQQLYIFQHVG